MSESRSKGVKIPSPTPPEGLGRVNNLFMAALLWASRNNCSCRSCERLKKVAELMEESMEEL